MKFDKEKWATYSIDDEYREEMLNDLTAHYKLRGSSNKQIRELLGEPEYVENMDLIYEIYTDFDVIDPCGGERLIFHLDKDSIVSDFRVEKWTNRRHKWWMWH